MCGAVIAIQTFGDFLGFNPHCRILVTYGCFSDTGMFRVAPPFELKKLVAIFKHKVFRMLLAKEKSGRRQSPGSQNGTNHMTFGATTIAAIYKDRWQIEIFSRS